MSQDVWKDKQTLGAENVGRIECIGRWWGIGRNQVEVLDLKFMTVHGFIFRPLCREESDLI